MKNIRFILILAVCFPLLIMSCLKEDTVSAPQVSNIKYYMLDVNGEDSLITEIFAGKRIHIAVETDADMTSVWPGGIRILQKKKNSTIDSLDWNGNPVLIKSDWYGDYGLVGAIGYKTSIKKQIDEEFNEWYCSYIYPSPGQYDLTVVITNHGYDGFAGLKQVAEEIKVTVK